ncbi:MAG: acetolactate synthase large subunit, partial [Clostridia bacterium]|nr:acetolactate synthase large subunit [Clostridia bacterium]
IPMVAITGNVSRNLIGKDSFQEINITGVTLPITKHNYFVNDVSELADTIREAFKIAKSGRPGPVLVDVPKDVQASLCEFVPQDIVAPFEQAKASDESIAEAIKLISECQKPYIYVGGGAVSADVGSEIMELAETIDAYMGCTLMGLSAIPTDHERFLGMEGMHGHYASSVANSHADLVIGIGVRFSDRATGNTSTYCKDAKIIQLDCDQSEINKNIQVDTALIGDLKHSLQQILNGVQKSNKPQWDEEVRQILEKEQSIADRAAQLAGDRLTPAQIFDIINDLKSEDTVVATDVGQHQMWSAQYLRFDKVRKFASSGGLGTMGYGLGAAIGAQVGSGTRSILVTGDGSFGMNLNELATASYYNLPVTVILLNNGVLGMVRQWQTLFFGKRYSHTVLDRKTDFVKLADAFGMPGERVCDQKSFEKALERSLNSDGPSLIEVMIDQDEFVLPMVPPGGSMSDLITTKEVKE